MGWAKMGLIRPAWLLGSVGALLAASFAGTSPAQMAPASFEPATTGGPAVLRRLNEAQYARSIHDIFGADIKVPGRFDPPLRASGLLAIGDGRAGVSSSGIEQAELRAREIAAQVMAEERRKAIMPCAPVSPQAHDARCAATFFGKYGRLLYRRPLSDREMAATIAIASVATGQARSFHKGLEAGLSRLLVSPQFIFRIERSEPGPVNAAARRLDDYSLASRISFLLWDAPPDAALLDAAAGGALRDPAGLERQVDRLIASPRFSEGTRAFFSDMFGYEQFDALSKDQAIFPKYTSQLAKDAREQALRTIVDLLVTRQGDYREMFTTRDTFINRNLGALYRVPVEGEAMQGWAPYSFAPEEPRGGILTLAGFLMLDATHEGRSSPTIRGKAVREMFLCEEVPMPPANVNFAVVQDTSNPLHRTARDRLKLHSEDASCAACHKITDPIGLAMENYDGIGAFRSHENGAPIDASGVFDGKSYRNLMELSQLLRISPAAPACLVQRAYEYGAGRQLSDSEGSWLEYAAQAFAADRYTFPALMRRIAASKAFRTVSGDRLAAAEPEGRRQ